MYEKGLVSVILPTYNRAHIIGEAIRSVLNQTFKNLELIVVDDGCSDNTTDVVKSFEDPRIKLISPGHSGLAGARNNGIGVAGGEYIAFIDDDDLYLPRKLETQVAFLEANPRIGVAYSPYIEQHDGKEMTHKCRQPDGDVFLRLFRGSFVNINTILVRKKCVDEIGGFNRDLTVLEEFDFYLRLAERFYFGFVDEVCSIYRMPVRDPGKDLGNYLIYKDYLEKCPERFLKLKEHREVFKWRYGKLLFGLGKSYFRAGDLQQAAHYVRESLKFRWQPDVVIYLWKLQRKIREGRREK